MDYEVRAIYAHKSAETFQRHNEAEAEALATELEKDRAVTSVEINGKPFLNSDGDNGLYLHKSDGVCPVCVKVAHVAGQCDNCGLPSANDREHGGPVTGYYSVRPTHFHSKQGDGSVMRQGIHAVLCYSCHREDRRNVYGENYGEEIAA